MKCKAPSCQHAKRRHCDCPCDGSQHGTAPLRWAVLFYHSELKTKLTPEQTAEFHSAQNLRASAMAFLVKRAEMHQKLRKKKLASDDVVAVLTFMRFNNTVDYLQKEIETAFQLQKVTAVLDDVCTGIVKSHPTKHARLLDHFWCDFTVAFVQVLQAITTPPPASVFHGSPGSTVVSRQPGAHERVFAHMFAAQPQTNWPELLQRFRDESETPQDWQFLRGWFGSVVWRQMRENRSMSRGVNPTSRKPKPQDYRSNRDGSLFASKLGPTIVEDAADRVLSVFLGQMASIPLKPVILKMQILTLLLCPDPYSHEDVWNSCVVPLVGTAEFRPAFSDGSSSSEPSEDSTPPEPSKTSKDSDENLPETGLENLMKFFEDPVIAYRR